MGFIGRRADLDATKVKEVPTVPGHDGLRVTVATVKKTRERQPITLHEQKKKKKRPRCENVLMETVHLNAGT